MADTSLLPGAVLAPVPAAAPGALVVSPADRDTAIRTCFGEADGEPDEGIAGVAWTIRTRSTWPEPVWWGFSIYGVCRKRMQFDCWIPGTADYERTMKLSSSDPQYLRIAAIVAGVFAGTIADPTAGATHYKRTGTKASWDKAAAQVVPRIIGHHSFYRLGPYA